LAAVAVAVYQPFFFSAVAQTGVAIGTVVAIGSAPLFAGLLGLTALREKPDRFWAAATGLSILGCGLLFLSGEESGVSGLGVLLALGAGAAYAVYATCGKILLKTQSPDALGAVVFSIAAVLLLPCLLLINFDWPDSNNSYLILLHLGLITTMAAYILFARGLSSVPASTAVTLSLSEPLTAGLLGIFLLGESVTPQTLVGLILLVAGLALLAMRPE
jgi:DME family drug/metabolite transporter